MLPVSDFQWSFLFATTAGVTIHLFAYPGLVWLLSHFFYYHTFDYWQTFNFGLTEHIVKAMIIYNIPYLVGFNHKNRLKKEEANIEKAGLPVPSQLSFMLVADTNNKKVSIAVSEVLYFSANPPYFNIHHPTKKYLHTGTLKSLEAELNPQAFVRIHKSFLVNMRSVVSFQSRLNGDYDLALIDGTILRVSRNYAAAFKKSFDEHHQVNTK